MGFQLLHGLIASALAGSYDSATMGASRMRQPEWVTCDDESLLDFRFCDLDLRLQGNALEARFARLHQELKLRGIRFRPHFWISYEWFVAHGVPGIAVPFYLLHPRLARLEMNQVGEVEGGTAHACLQILRHEAGHALENAYHLRRRREVQQVFGHSAKVKYPSHYEPRPYSKAYVRHLKPNYAQSHPDEDFAETFAVWLTPGSGWRARYAGWPAFRKLEVMDTLMKELRGVSPLTDNRGEIEPISEVTRTLRSHYRKRREGLGLDRATILDRDLRTVFCRAEETRSRERASRFLSRVRSEVRYEIASRTGEYQYTVDKVLKDAIQRCRALDLRMNDSPVKARAKLTRLLTKKTIRYIERGHHQVAL